MSRHVLVIGIDGVRADVLRKAHVPHITAIGEAGFWEDVRVDERNPTISAPVWASVASGVHRDRHGIDDNDLHNHHLDQYPDFLSRVRAHDAAATTFAAAAWAPLVTGAAGGPVFAPGGFRPDLPTGVEDGTDDAALAAIAVMDEVVTSRTARELLSRDHAAVFAYLLLPDMAAHAEGITDRYRAAIERADEQVGVLLAAIAARPRRSAEEWTVVVLTDHGHRDGGHHGGDSDAERTGWIAASGPGIDAGVVIGASQADVGVHALHVLGVAVPPGLDGRPWSATSTPPQTSSA
ncbi:alkaline phosphatase family protein [Microbacterium sp. ZW T5_56]|uniref:alkaline phosphatase family protein n=1 Tax=Microbacterium sp. ZW T5_56 TaxID=3378081 RepID=UPI0038519BE3